MKFSFLILTIFFLLSFSLGQSLKNRLLVPIYIYPSISFGYDSNILKLSGSEIEKSTLNTEILGRSATFDSQIIKPKLKILYSPVLSDKYESEFLISFSHSLYGQLNEKSYNRYSLVYGQHLGPYSWLKIGYSNLPKYFIRDYIDHDITGNVRFPCSLSSEEIFISYSFPVWQMSWLRFKVKGINEFYNSNFTEFDQQKLIRQLDFHSGLSKRTKYSVSIIHENSVNITYDSELISADIDRSYLMDKLILSFSHGLQSFSGIEKAGLALSAEQRLYELSSTGGNIDDWKFYFESSVSFWSIIDVHDDIGLKISYQFRNRDADSNPLGGFSWIEDIKDFSKHLIWVEFSYDITLDLFY